MCIRRCRVLQSRLGVQGLAFAMKVTARAEPPGCLWEVVAESSALLRVLIACGWGQCVMGVGATVHACAGIAWGWLQLPA
jgi:hypothetical protein